MANPCSAVFQAGGLVVVLVEVSRKQYLASIVPVIVNAILNEHQIVVDIVAFVAKGDFPRSRLGEKQRGKILANWVTRKLRTIAQFAIRDVDAAVMGEVNSPGGVAMEPRASMVSVQSGGAGAGAGVPSLRNMEQAAPPQILEQEEHEYPAENRFSFMPAPRITNMADAADPSVATGDYHGVADAVPPVGHHFSASGAARSLAYHRSGVRHARPGAVRRHRPPEEANSRARSSAADYVTERGWSGGL